MYFDGASWWVLLMAGLLMVGAFWYAEHLERKQRRIRRSGYLAALRRIHERKP